MATRPASAVVDERVATRPAPGEHQLITVTVTANEQLAEHVRRLSLAAPEFRDLQLSAPDEFFGLLMPPEGQVFQPFQPFPGNIRSIVSEIDEETRPNLRWYTVRNLDQHAGILDVDVVTHGDTGPGSHWALRAEPGDTAGVYTCNGIWSRPASAGLYIADATAVPALRSILEHLAEHEPAQLADTHIVVVAPSEGHLEPGFAEEWADRVATLRMSHTTPDDRAAHIERLLDTWTREGHPAADVDYVWACGEEHVAKTARTVAVKKWGIDPSSVGWAVFWFLGRARP